MSYSTEEIVDISQVNIEEMIREYDKEEVARLMNVIMENNVMMLKLQKQILELQVAAEERKKEERRKQEDRKQRRREYEERWKKKEQRRRKEREEKEERKRINNE